MPAFNTCPERVAAAEEIRRLAGHVVCAELEQALWTPPQASSASMLKFYTHSHEVDRRGNPIPLPEARFSLQFRFIRESGLAIHPLVEFAPHFATVVNHDSLVFACQKEEDLARLEDSEAREAVWNETMTETDGHLRLWLRQLQPVQLRLPEPSLPTVEQYVDPLLSKQTG